MKKIFLFCTRLRMYWVLLPIAALLGACIAYNEHADNLLKFYPLIILSIAAIIFIFIYFFRVISVSYDEIRYIGLFTSRDSAMINEGKTIIVERVGRAKKFAISLFGNDGVVADLDWLKSTGDAPRDISLFRGKATGGDAAIRRLLLYFGASKELSETILRGIEATADCELTSIEHTVTDEKSTIKIHINKTV